MPHIPTIQLIRSRGIFSILLRLSRKRLRRMYLFILAALFTRSTCEFSVYSHSEPPSSSRGLGYHFVDLFHSIIHVFFHVVLPVCMWRIYEIGDDSFTLEMSHRKVHAILLSKEKKKRLKEKKISHFLVTRQRTSPYFRFWSVE
jgi:hypothetical protein